MDVGTFAMNSRTTLSDLTPKTMKSGSPGHEQGVIHHFHERTVVTMIVQNRVAKNENQKFCIKLHKAVSQPPLVVLHANNNGIIVFHMERRVG